MKKPIKIILVLALIALIIIQFIRPERNDGGYEGINAFEAETKPSEQVATILQENCYDCHSNHTEYPWYSNIAPFSYWQQAHVEDGKKHFNVSKWESLSTKKKEHGLEEVIEMVEDDEMPLWSYTILHGDISEAEKKLLLQWAGVARLRYKHQLEVSAK